LERRTNRGSRHSARQGGFYRLAPVAALALLLSVVLAGPAFAHHKPGHPVPPGQDKPPTGDVHDNRGTVKIHEGGSEPSPIMRNQPKVCEFHVHGFKFHADQDLTISIVGHGGPNAGDDSWAGTATTDGSGEFREPTTGAFELEDGMYKLTVGTGHGNGGKHKVFKIDCAVETPNAPELPTGGDNEQEGPENPNPGNDEQEGPENPNPGNNEQEGPENPNPGNDEQEGPENPNPGNNEQEGPENPNPGDEEQNAPPVVPKPDQLPNTATELVSSYAFALAAVVVLVFMGAGGMVVLARRRLLT
jgi:hypothetical protein